MKPTPLLWELIPLEPSDTRKDLGDFLIRAKGAPGGIAITIGGLGEEEKANAELIVRAVNLFDVLLSNLKYEHEEAVGEEHFEKVAAGDMGCSVCALLAKAVRP